MEYQKDKQRLQLRDGYAIRIPVDMIQHTDKEGRVYPIAFYWNDSDDQQFKVDIDRVVSVTRQAEPISGAIGDRYECEIDGKREILYYSLIQPRKWFKVVPVSKNEYEAYYKMPGEK